jgi:uncharacterized protein
MLSIVNHLPDIAITSAGMVIVAVEAWWLLRLPRIADHPKSRRLVLACGAFACGLMGVALMFRSSRIAHHFPPSLVVWTGTVALVLLLVLAGALGISVLARIVPRRRPEHSVVRRQLLLAARGAVLATPVAAAGYAVFIQRSDLTFREIKIPVAGLPRELEGLSIVQLSDIHLSAFLREKELARAVDMANECRAHIALVTGDLITSGSDPLDRCLFQLSRLRSEAGTLGCLGNHEVYADAEDYATAQGRKAGIDFLRSRSRVLNFRGKSLNFAGVDYQRMHEEYLPGAERLIRPAMPNILLSHNPDVFPVAARKGFDLTISGHTHGGQITMEILNQNLSIARFYTPYVYGLYREGASSVYVTRGIGTVGVPARFGAPPEVALIKLCAI